MDGNWGKILFLRKFIVAQKCCNYEEKNILEKQVDLGCKINENSKEKK